MRSRVEEPMRSLVRHHLPLADHFAARDQTETVLGSERQWCWRPGVWLDQLFTQPGTFKSLHRNPAAPPMIAPVTGLLPVKLEMAAPPAAPATPPLGVVFKAA